MSSIFKDFFAKRKENKQPGKIIYTNEPTSNDWQHTEAYISGRVQAVGFRFTTKNLADQLGVYGQAKNLADGRVWVEAYADKQTMKKFIQELAIGPSPSAIVDQITITYLDDESNLDSFEIIY